MFLLQIYLFFEKEDRFLPIIGLKGAKSKNLIYKIFLFPNSYFFML